MKTYLGRFNNGEYLTQNGAEVVKLLNNGIAIKRNSELHYEGRNNREDQIAVSYFVFEDTAELREVLK